MCEITCYECKLGFLTYKVFYEHVIKTHMELPLIQKALKLAPDYCNSPFRMKILLSGERNESTMPETMLRPNFPYWYLEICADDVRYALFNVPGYCSDDEFSNKRQKLELPDREMLLPIEKLSRNCWDFSSVVACIINVYRFRNNREKIIRRSVLNHCLYIKE